MSLVLDASAALAWIYPDETSHAARGILETVMREGAWVPALWRLEATLRLAERHRLTVYDAAYLELALRRMLPIATLDRELRTAAEAESAVLLGVIS